MIPKDTNKIQITKLDAVRRQLETAITLWFHDADPVSIHTLVAAAYQVIYDLNAHRAGSPMMFDDSCIRPEKRKYFKDLMSEYENFFKHADRDPIDTILFPPEVTCCYIIDATRKYRELANEQRPLFKLFATYLSFQKPDIFKEDYIKQLQETTQGRLNDISKLQFFNLALPLFSRLSL